MTALVIHAAATWFMTGLIWFVQVVHYPLFDRVGAEIFVRYQSDHMRLTTHVVGPMMLVEAVTAGYVMFNRPVGFSGSVLWLNVGLLVMIWLSTAFLQVPRHNALLKRFEIGPHQALVMTNWIRTLAWTLRSLLVGWTMISLVG